MKFSFYLGDQRDNIAASMAKTGDSPSYTVRNRVRKSYEAEIIIRNLLGVIDAIGNLSDGPVITVTGPDIEQAKEYLSETVKNRTD